jgi:hypothetical protein
MPSERRKQRSRPARSSSARRFSGTVLAEWLNVTGGVDASPDWLFLHRHLMRVGRRHRAEVGIDGSRRLDGMPLKKASPERYGTLEHPADALAHGLYTEAGCGRQARRRSVPPGAAA